MKDLFYRNPWIRTLLPLILLTIASITANTLVVEITKGNTLEWLEIPKKTSFYILFFCTILTAIYQVLLFKFDNTFILKGLTPKQYEAALRNKVVEESANKVNELIQKGDWESLEIATEKFKKLFGENIQ